MLHAKAVVADAAAAFITSANLTGSALDHNLELGVLIRGGAVPTGGALRRADGGRDAAEGGGSRPLTEP